MSNDTSCVLSHTSGCIVEAPEMLHHRVHAAFVLLGDAVLIWIFMYAFCCRKWSDLRRICISHTSTHILPRLFPVTRTPYSYVLANNKSAVHRPGIYKYIAHISAIVLINMITYEVLPYKFLPEEHDPSPSLGMGRGVKGGSERFLFVLPGC